MARVAATLAAQEAVKAGAVGAAWALRQSLADLAAVCELLADEMPTPDAVLKESARVRS